ncbi:MAG TPA: hypothetical protein VGV35_08080, partial [Bryobacteraceae bacterium]|nr:hypothetical protein [Bryobacteraceae bacterium]
MRRRLIIAAFVLFLGLVPASAQRGGMRSSGGGGGVAVGHPAGGHGFSGMRAGGMRAGLGVRPSFSRGGFGRDGFGRVRIRIRTRPFRHCFGCFSPFASPWWGWGSPLGWWDSSSSYDYDQEREQQSALANQMNAVNIQEQNLREREDWLEQREQQEARRPQAREEDRAALSPATLLVFRDQHQQEINNYAIAGNTLWVLSDHILAKKIPLAELDLEATTK